MLLLGHLLCLLTATTLEHAFDVETSDRQIIGANRSFYLTIPHFSLIADLTSLSDNISTVSIISGLHPRT